jgi:hypothetical protein
MAWYKRYRGGFALLAVAAGVIILWGAAWRWWWSRQDAKTQEVARQLTGEWLLSSPHPAPDEPVVIWTFKSNGIVRLDAIDPKTQKRVREGSMVGRWQAKGDEIFCIWEVWNDKQHRPAREKEAQEGFHLRTISKSELEMEVVSRSGKLVAGGECLLYKRYSGWRYIQ